MAPGRGLTMDDQIDLEAMLGTEDVSRLLETVAGLEDQVLVVVSDEEGNVLWASEVGSQAFAGRSRAEMVEAKSAIHPEDVALVERATERVLAGETIDLEYRTQSRHGGWRRVRSIGWPVTPSPGGRAAFVSVTVKLDREEAGPGRP